MLEQKMDELRRLRDEFFSQRPTGSSDDRSRLVKEKALLLLQEVPLVSSGEPASRVNNSLTCGKILNISPDYDQKCEEYLSKAVKLDPNLVEAWNELGNCLLKKPDVLGAKTCFETSIEKEKNADALRSLSFLLRQSISPESTSDERKAAFKRSLDLAQESIRLEAENAESWYAFGNANLTYFFASNQESSTHIEEALKSYRTALECDPECNNPTLYFNYAQALKFAQSYDEAMKALRNCQKYDPAFREARDSLQNLVAYLRRVAECVQRRGKLKPKRLQEFVKALTTATTVNELGPYLNGELHMQTGLLIKLNAQPIERLTAGPNQNMMLVVKVVGLVVNEETIPYSFAVVDAAGDCCAVTVFNFSEHFGVTLGTTVVIPEPYVIDVRIADDGDGKSHFRCIRVPTPEILVVNGRKLGRKMVACCQAKFSTVT